MTLTFIPTRPSEGPDQKLTVRVNLARIRSAVPDIHCRIRVPRIERVLTISRIWRIKWSPNHHRKLRSSWTKVHQIFTRCSQGFCAVNAPIYFSILHAIVVECESQEGRHVADFCRFRALPWQRPLTVWETNTKLNIYTNMYTIPENWVKIGLVVSEISLPQAIFKKRKKRKKEEKRK